MTHTDEQVAARERVYQKRRIREKLQELGLSARTTAGKDTFQISVPVMLKLLGMEDHQIVLVAVNEGPNTCECGRDHNWAGRCPVCDS